MSTEDVQTPTDTNTGAARRIRQALRDADAALVAEHPWLGRDDAVALGLFFGALVASALVVASWLSGLVPGWLAVLAIALTTSVLHELEHDLIHDEYLSHPVVRGGVLATIWLAKGNLDPWTRGHMHRWHHIVSGQDEDIEERLIGSGMAYGVLRAFVTFLPAASIIVRPRLKRAVRARVAAGGRGPDPRAYSNTWPLLLGNIVVFTAPFWLLGAYIAGQAWAGSVLLLWVLPNLVRHAAIVTMSSNSHYVGIDRGDVVQQNQILDHPMFLPLQLLCWNFGATHVLHHFLVRQPFWRRTLVFSSVREVLVDNGVPANDLGTFGRANRREGRALGSRDSAGVSG